MIKDYKNIKQDFIKVIQHSQNIPEPQVDALFEAWATNKRKIYSAFGDKLIVEIDKPISFELSEEAKYGMVQHFIDMCYDLGYEDLSLFLTNERDGFFKNICANDYGKIKKGTKLIRSFRYFIDDKEKLNDIQSKASQLIQENKVNGKLCFSIHPLDYLSISENNYNWRSCHALDGEYRAGNLSYMMDSSTIVCYIKGEENVVLPRFPEDVRWNSKKWRVLFYLSNDWKMIYAGKQYPFSTLDGMNMIVNKFFNKDPDLIYRKPNADRDNYQNAAWCEWMDYKYPRLTIPEKKLSFEFTDDYIPVGNGIVGLTELVKDFPDSQQFNDVLNSSSYCPMYTYITQKTWWSDECFSLANADKTRFSIGASCSCIRCGMDKIMPAGSGTMMCGACEEEYGDSVDGLFSCCDICGSRMLNEDGYYIEDDMFLCPFCYNEKAEICNCCGEPYLTENMAYDEDEDLYYCKWCKTSNKERY